MSNTRPLPLLLLAGLLVSCSRPAVTAQDNGSERPSGPAATETVQPVTPEPAVPRDLRVVTWNLKWFPGGRPGADKTQQDEHITVVREEIRKLAPDILLLQEVSNRAVVEETLAPLGQWHVAVVSEFKQGGFTGGQQQAIAARFPADAAWASPWEKGWAEAPRGYSYAVFVIGGKRVGVYSLHLKSNLGDAAANTSKREDAAGQLVRHMGAEAARSAPADILIVGGDFNTDDPDQPQAPSPGERTFTLLRDAGFWWTFEGIPHAARITCPGNGRYPDACFDHFLTKGAGKPAARVVQAAGSDHFPVVLDLAL